MTSPQQRDPHEVFNQPPPLQDYNLFSSDIALMEAVRREGGGWIEPEAKEFGAVLGSAEVLHLAVLANRYPPELHTHNRFGDRIDEVEYHPAYHQLMAMAMERAVHCLPWVARRSGAHVARAALFMLRTQLEEGISCPLTMTFAVVPSLRLQPELAAEWEPRVIATTYDSRFVPAAQKRSALFGMGMTERQGGSDVRANTTVAEPVEGGTGYRLRGHKWFCSAPMCDAFLVLAQAPGGLTCFLLPRWLPDGSRNAFRLQRLKEKLGNRSNASSEVEFAGAWAQRVGEEGRGVPTIIEMVRHTRLDCVLGAAATIRRAVAEATHHAAHRSAFGRRLIEQPLMKNVLADLCLESEAATALALRLARGFDESPGDDMQRSFTRVATAIGKYWVTKRVPATVAEALECVGGNGYVEESPFPRLYRDAPLNSLWEGAGNVQCLDVLRALNKQPETMEALQTELRKAAGLNRLYDSWLERLTAEAGQPETIEFRARRLVEQLGLALQASVLLRNDHPTVGDAFCASRLADQQHLAFGTLPTALDVDFLIERARPQF
jgi:putative acyl-CoA dehydrogenase